MGDIIDFADNSKKDEYAGQGSIEEAKDFQHLRDRDRRAHDEA
jgi:hypothetical protein